ncbi:hypothetical protein H8958_022698 [Nasalis larvatus]
MEDAMDVDTSPLRPQNRLFGCELKADKDDHFKVENDENEHQLRLRTVPQKKVKLAAAEDDDEDNDEEEDDDFDDEEAEEKAPVKKSI